MEGIVIWLVGGLTAFIAKIGYLGIVLLMTIESSFIPFPSEVVIPPAAYLAQQGHFNIYLVVLSGLIGSLLGALINYYLALSLGRKFVYFLLNHRIASWLMLSEAKVKRAEKYFLKYGGISTFFGRLVTVVRQLISLPAGFSKMKLSSFVVYTALGSGIWVSILAFLGYAFGSNQEVLEKYYNLMSWLFVILAAGLIIWLIAKKKVGRAGNNS